MSELNSQIIEKRLPNNIPQKEPLIQVFSATGPIEVKSINLNEDGTVAQLIDINDNILDLEEIFYTKYLLEVPGIGYIAPNTPVVYKESDYILKFGWHTNISNQTIYSWYLEPLSSDNQPCKTLYKEMINQVDEFHFN